MVDVFVPHGYASKTFWKHRGETEKVAKTEESRSKEIQPFSVYQIDQPHVIRKRYGHLGVSPRCRASAPDSIDLVRKVLQPAINKDIVDVFKKYVVVFRNAAENVCANMKTEPFTKCCSPSDLNIDSMAYKACCDALENCKPLFEGRKPVKETKTEAEIKGAIANKYASSVASSLPSHLMSMKRVPSPDFPSIHIKRLSKGSPRRSLSPTPRKRGRPTPTKRYGSPQRNTKEPRRITWDPDKLTTDTKFVMGTRANKALGLGATRGRIYMKHPDLFKYSSDPEDKKWMVKNNCMVATGGKNTFIMIADDIYDLLENEYKDSAGLQPEEMQVFTLPEFVLQKMRAIMIKEKRLSEKLLGKTASPLPRPDSRPKPAQEWLPPKSSSLNPEVKITKLQIKVEEPLPHHSKRPAAERAAAAITASSGEGETDEGTDERHSVNATGTSRGESSSGDESSQSESSNGSHHLSRNE